MSRPDEGMIHAWLDGELAPEEATRVAELAESDPEWRAAVADARGFIAASSRIVGALDAVPGGVVPRSTLRTRPQRRVRSWIGIAAGFVLVAGTAYVVRDATQEAFSGAPSGVASGSVDAPAASAAPAAAKPPGPPPQAPGDRPSAVARDVPPPATPMPRTTATSADATADAAGSGARAAGGAGALGDVSGVPAGVAAKIDDAARQDLRRAEAEVRTQAKATAERLAPAPAPPGSRNAMAARAAVAAPAISVESALPRQLEGCWLASAPDSLARVYSELEIVRAAGDTLELRISGVQIVVVVRVRDGERDELRGGLTARRAECPRAP